MKWLEKFLGKPRLPRKIKDWRDIKHAPRWVLRAKPSPTGSPPDMIYKVRGRTFTYVVKVKDDRAIEFYKQKRRR